jgi:hypothetical protein
MSHAALGAPQSPRGRRKTAFIDGSDKGPQLIQRHPIEHVFVLLYL